MLQGWIDFFAAGLRFSTVCQQIMSVIAQTGGIAATETYDKLCVNGPFRDVDRSCLPAFFANSDQKT